MFGACKLEVTDELYTDLVLQPSAQVLLSGEATEVEGEQPVLDHTWDRGGLYTTPLDMMSDPRMNPTIARLCCAPLAGPAPQLQAEGKELQTMTSVEGRSILITGGGGGIGFGAARHFIERGARVTICGRREENGKGPDALGQAAAP